MDALAAAERMGCRDHHVRPHLGQRVECKLRRHVGVVEERDVDPALQQHFRQFGSGRFGEVEFEFGVLALKHLHDTGQQEGRQRRETTDGEAAAKAG